LKLIKKLSGLAIGLSLIYASQWLQQHTQEQFLKRIYYKPIQIKIEKNRSQISKDFYLEFDAMYDLLLTRSGVEVNKNKIATPSIKAEISINNQKIDIYQSVLDSCQTQSICRIGYFRGVAKQKYTMIMDINIVDNNLYNLNPTIESRISITDATKGYKIGEELKVALLFATGFFISITMFAILAIEFIVQIYKNNKYP
jgi:hypothetical protein